jgi:hypothetical protein
VKVERKQLKREHGMTKNARVNNSEQTKEWSTKEEKKRRNWAKALKLNCKSPGPVGLI